MTFIFYISAAVAILCTAMVITRLNAVHALLYMIVSLLAAAMMFFTLGAPFAAALEVIIYAGAIMVLFVFVIMMLNLGVRAETQESLWLQPRTWVGPAGFALILALEVIYLLARGRDIPAAAAEVAPKEVAITLLGPYILGVELASLLLLAGLVGAYHLGQRTKSSAEESEGES